MNGFIRQGASLDEVCKAAKKAGMSYGKYVGLDYLQKNKIKKRRRRKQNEDKWQCV